MSFTFFGGRNYGIIGLNGSGKSTLLQIASGTLTPDTGSVIKPKKTHALLELGSGFDPDFSGLENAKLIASLYESKSSNADDYLSKVEKFADIGVFFREPVRTYSSGMLARVAFSVHANLNPDVFIIDEAIAVGDLPFQTKCFSLIKSLAQNGTTIIFVSHDIPLIRSFCDQVLYLESGSLISSGDPTEVCDLYVSRAMLGKKMNSDRYELNRSDAENSKISRSGSGNARFGKVDFEDFDPPFSYGQKIKIKADVDVFCDSDSLDFGLTILDKTGQPICYTDSRLEMNSIHKIKTGDRICLVVGLICTFAQGYYSICFTLSEGGGTNPKTFDYFPNAISFEVFENENKIHAFTKLSGEISFKIK